MTAHPIEPLQIPVKAALDHAELVAREPALQPSAARYELMHAEHDGRVVFSDYKLTDNGALILKWPRHHLVAAYSYELASANAKRRYDGDLRTARRKLKDATVNYENRVNWRNVRGMDPHYVCLSAILEARAEAVYWSKIVKEADLVAKIKRRNAQNITRNRLSKLGLAY